MSPSEVRAKSRKRRKGAGSMPHCETQTICSSQWGQCHMCGAPQSLPHPPGIPSASPTLSGDHQHQRVHDQHLVVVPQSPPAPLPSGPSQPPPPAGPAPQHQNLFGHEVGAAMVLGYTGVRNYLKGCVNWHSNQPECQCNVVRQRRSGWSKKWRKRIPPRNIEAETLVTESQFAFAHWLIERELQNVWEFKEVAQDNRNVFTLVYDRISFECDWPKEEVC